MLFELRGAVLRKMVVHMDIMVRELLDKSHRSTGICNSHTSKYGGIKATQSLCEYVKMEFDVLDMRDEKDIDVRWREYTKQWYSNVLP